MNSRRLLQVLIIAQWLLLIGSAIAGSVEQRYLPQLLKSYQAEKPAELVKNSIVLMCLGWIYLVAYLMSSIALFRNKAWAKRLYVSSIFIGLIFRIFLGTRISTPIAGALGGLSMACIGGTIGVLFYTKETFAGSGGSERNDNAASSRDREIALQTTAQMDSGEQAVLAVTLTGSDRIPFLKELVQNLKSGLRAAALLKVEPSGFRISAEQLLALVGVNLILSFLVNLIHAGTNGEFNFDYLPSALFYLPLMVVASYAIASFESKHDLRLSIPIALISAGLWIEVAGSLVDLAAKDAWLNEASFFYGMDHYYRLFGWWCISSYLIIHRLAGPYRNPVPVKLIFLFILAIPFWFVPKWDLWTESYDDTDPPKQTIVKEEVFYSQPALLEKKLSALKPGRKGNVDLYFVGFGSDSSQDVFMKEIDVITKLFDERFDTRGRSIALINNAKTVESVPIATRTALERTVRQIGKRMDEEDVLFLYLTSHGSENQNLLVDFWPLQLNEINPEIIKKILDDAGITWRVVVVSACYSGGFIKPLKDENTLIITSADASSSSFGCGNDSNFTYFGKAYFDNALRKSYSFVKPFGEVNEEILKREQDGSEKPSNPQIHVGTAIGKHLKKLERRLQKLGGA
jgi:hypothetical protein